MNTSHTVRYNGHWALSQMPNIT